MDRLETRELTYFLAVAEELHFGRAADRLGIAQPPLSRAIKQLEHRLGAVLFDRSGRRITLTPAGEVLLHEGRKALDAVAAAARRTRRAARSEPKLVLATKGSGDSGLITDILTAFEADPAGVPVEVSICGIGDQARMLRDGRADVALLHGPWDDTSGFDTEVLAVEQQVAAVSHRHPLATRASVRMADLDAETLPRWPGMPAGVESGPEVRDTAELMHLVALGRVIAVLPESARTHTRRDVVCVPIVDAGTTTVLLAWPERSRSATVAAFVRIATEIAARRPDPAVVSDLTLRALSN